MEASSWSARDWYPSPPPVFIQSLVRMPAAIHGARRNALRAVVLRAAVDVVKRQPVVHRHAIELRHRNIVEVPPGAAVVVAFVEPAVVAFDQVILVGGVEDQRVVVGVETQSAAAATSAAEGILHGLAAVFGHEDGHVHGVDAVELERIGENFAVIFRVLHFLVDAPRVQCSPPSSQR